MKFKKARKWQNKLLTFFRFFPPKKVGLKYLESLGKKNGLPFDWGPAYGGD